MELLERLNLALDRHDLQLVSAAVDGPARLLLPAAGVPVTELAVFATAVFADAKLADVVNPATLGFTVATDSPLRNLVLTRFEVESRDDPGASCLLEVRWRGEKWDVINGLLSIHDPGAVVQITRPEDSGSTPSSPISHEISATLFGGFLLAGEVDVDIFATVWHNDGQTEAPSVYGNLGRGGPYKLKPLLSKVGFDLPGTDVLTIDELSFLAQTGEHPSVTFGVSLAEWRPGWGEGEFILTDVSLAMTKAGDTLTGKISATATVAGTPCSIEVENQGNGWRLSAAVDFVPNLDVAEAVGKLGAQFGLGDVLAEAPGLEKLKVDKLALEIGLEDHSLDFTLSTPKSADGVTTRGNADYAWEPCEGFAIENLAFRITHLGKPQSNTTVAVTGTLNVCGLELEAQVDHEGRDLGWTLAVTADLEKRPLSELTSGNKALPTGLGLVASDFGSVGDDVTVNRLELHANTKTKNVSMALGGSLDVGGKTLGLTIKADLTKPPGAAGYDKAFSGTVTLDQLEFDLLFSRTEEDGTAIVAAFENHGGRKLSIENLLKSLGAKDVSLPFDLAIQKAVFVAVKGSSQTSGKAESNAEAEPKYHYILAVDIGGGLNLSQLPLVSKVVPADQALEVAFQPLYASRPFTAQEVGRFQKLLPKGAPALTVSSQAQAIKLGGKIATHLRLGGRPMELPWEFSPPEHENGPVTPPPSDPPQGAHPKDLIKWFSIQKSLGPVHFQRLGLGLKITPEPEIELLLDASLSAGGLTLSLIGLGAGYKLSTKNVVPLLSGLGLAYEAGPAVISGTFLKLGDLDFVGEALIHTSSFGISALGAYSDGEAGKSLFVYAFLDYPLGGPPFFFVEGLAAGFGYNREVRDVPIGQVAKFPLVTEAVGAEKTKPPKQLLPPPPSAADAQDGLIKKMESLNDWIHPVAGEHFLALGVKFNSFKLIDSFALAIVSFGHRLRFDMLGKSTAVMPAAEPGATGDSKKLAVIEMAFKVSYDPAEGLLGVQAQLTDQSWVLSPDCLLTGGFAFYSWLTGPHAGDFVTTIGGYHPAFKVPAHYPRVPRLGFKWQVDPHTLIKGGCYFALTPSAMMAGGFLEASWRDGGLWAEFRLGADFLIWWQPFHYQAHAYIEISGGVGSLSGSLGADLHLHGPKFGGTAEVHFLFVSFEVDFGPKALPPLPLNWEEFRKAFLPKEDAIVSLTVEHGLLRSMQAKSEGEKKRWIVNPKEFTLVVSTLVPYETLHVVKGPPALEQTTNDLPAKFGVAPMKVESAGVSSRHTITIKRDGKTLEDPFEDFEITPASKRFPAAMWSPPVALDQKLPGAAQHEGTPTLDGERTIEAFGRTLIVPRNPVKPSRTTEIPRKHLDYSVHEMPRVASPEDPGALHLQQVKPDPDGTILKATFGAPDPEVLLALGFMQAADIRLGEDLPGTFILPPHHTHAATRV